jgi:hypothetical protein
MSRNRRASGAPALQAAPLVNLARLPKTSSSIHSFVGFWKSRLPRPGINRLPADQARYRQNLDTKFHREGKEINAKTVGLLAVAHLDRIPLPYAVNSAPISRAPDSGLTDPRQAQNSACSPYWAFFGDLAAAQLRSLLHGWRSATFVS